MESTRLPRKVLLSQTGKPLVQHVVEAARRAACLAGGDVVVAADDERIAEALEPLGTKVILTSVDHPNGTSRVAEAARLLGLPGDAIVVNVQGDEPEVEPAAIDAAVGALRSSDGAIGTVGSPFEAGDDPSNPNVVKVVRRIDGTAMYFSRSPIPFDRDRAGGEDAAPLRHVGLYAYRAWFLEQYVKLPSTALERAESLEQLRALQHGYTIAVAVCRAGYQGIDTQEQYEAFVKRNTARLART
ncbi:MAG: 3-deoxy-manno-octulosonate cytidylyltransferase [Phycisphaerales bacterium]|nr:3-deoxy-manno-octulosonate cytidylyltransferase [Phycisphaerales bacterium]